MFRSMSSFSIFSLAFFGISLIISDLSIRYILILDSMRRIFDGADHTSNKGFSEWGEVLGDSVMASAVLDRILHHCTVINIKGESYRLKHRRKNSLPTMRKE